MEFGWINLFGGIIVLLLLIPNIVYALKNREERKLWTKRVMKVVEQAGRYGCIVWMWLPLLVWKFGFRSASEMLLYFLGNGVLLVAYWLVFARYMRKKTAKRALVLAILPACIFLLSGLLLRHWLLVGFGLLFAVGHIYVTTINAKGEARTK